jgi:transmembrane sensor
MESNNDRLNYLITQYLNKECTADEFAELFTYIGNQAYEEVLQVRMRDDLKSLKPGADVHQVDWDSIYNNVISSTDNNKVRNMFSRRLALAAAVTLLCTIGAGLWALRQKQPVAQQMAATKQKLDVKPGTDKAILKLADGREIILNNTAKGILTHEGQTAIKQQANGVIAYEAGANAQQQGSQTATNTLSIPSGGQYMLILPDNSKVWLNSNSSLTYATAFNRAERVVELIGEGYFEIAKDARHPFIVHSGRSSVRVLGTHFNISAYPDEKLNEVTLSEGSVMLTVGKQSAKIKPGQQASFNHHDDMIALREVDVDEAIDWKNGYFQFDNASMERVMNKIKHWYNIEIEYQGNQPAVKFTGMISRNNNLSKILDLLQSTGGVNFEIGNKKVIVKSK